MTAYDVEPWSDLFVASAGATAALAGLVFVAVSINVERILELEGVPSRALQALLQLILVVVVSVLVLAPGQATTALGIELALVAGLTVAASLALVGGGGEPGWGGIAVRRLIVLAGTVPFAIAGVSLTAEAGGGLYWALAGVVLATVGAVLNAWVLLVEIRR